ncbi:MAG: hypothetical protein AAGG81_05170, partial [Chlamydiota bacterium]
PKIENVIKKFEESLLAKDRQKVNEALNKYLKGAKHKPVAPDENNYFTVNALRYEMNALYGEETTEKALKRYGLENARAINEKELQIVITGMLSNLTLKGLEHIYNNRSNELLHISKCYKTSEKRFDQLSQEEVCKFMGELCSIAHKKLEVTAESPYFNQLSHDKTLLDCFRLMNHYRPKKSTAEAAVDISKYAYTEYLSRYIIYSLFDNEKANFPDGILIPMYDTKGNLVLKKAHTIVSKDGLHAVVIKPAMIEKGVRQEIQVVFRGTYCSKSLKRDISFTEKEFSYGFEGPGRRSFRESQDVIIDGIMKHLNDIYQKSGNEKVSVEFMGHSLGASDAKRALEKYTHHIVQNSDEQKKVSSVKLFVYNSPSVESDVAKRFINNVRKTDLKFKLRYFDADNDPVQGAGKVRLGYSGKESKIPDNVNASCYRFNRDVEEKVKMMAANFFSRIIFRSKRASKAHGAPFFCGIYPSMKDNHKNSTHIDKVVTNIAKDSTMRFGPKLEKTAKMSTPEELNEAMRTATWHIAKKIKSVRNNFFDFFFFERPASTT